MLEEALNKIQALQHSVMNLNKALMHWRREYDALYEKYTELKFRMDGLEK